LFQLVQIDFILGGPLHWNPQCVSQDHGFFCVQKNITE
jgi:hypothetical protein